MISEYWALIATYCDEKTALLLSQRCGTIQIKHTYRDENNTTITTINGVNSYMVTSYGTQKWYKNCRLHREDGPAMIWSDGTQDWYKHGKRHREDGPATIFPNGHKQWYRNGKRSTQRAIKSLIKK